MSTKQAQGSFLGKLAYRAYYRPMGQLKEVLHRGVSDWFKDELARKQMVEASYHLPAIVPRDNAATFEIFFLTGAKYYFQTAFCAWSLARQSPVNIRPVIHDDGTFTAEDQSAFRKIFPDARFVSLAESEAHLDKVLPESRFPRLRGHREIKPHLLKLCDFYAGTTEARLFLDSDMLFFREPRELIEWLRNPQGAVYMVDIHTAYGYPKVELETLTGTVIPEKINIGIMGLQGRLIDWDRIEHWIATLLDRHGAHYNITQGLCSMAISQQKPILAVPERQYVVLPTDAECEKPDCIMQHYVAESKVGYYRHGWKHALKASGCSAEEVLRHP